MEERSKSEIRGHRLRPDLVAVLLIGALLGGLVGYGFGIAWALNWTAKTGMTMLEQQGIKIEFNEKMIAAALYQYQNNIGGVINCENAHIRNDTGS